MLFASFMVTGYTDAYPAQPPVVAAFVGMAGLFRHAQAGRGGLDHVPLVRPNSALIPYLSWNRGRDPKAAPSNNCSTLPSGGVAARTDGKTRIGARAWPGASAESASDQPPVTVGSVGPTNV